jgi:hypothetical protein
MPKINISLAMAIWFKFWGLQILIIRYSGLKIPNCRTAASKVNMIQVITLLILQRDLKP